MSALIVRDDAKLSISFTKEAEQQKSEALESAALIGKVTNAAENGVAVEAQTKLQTLISLTEKARKICKQPVLDYGRAIDAAAEKFVSEVKDEMTRVSTIVGDFAALERAKIEAAERARVAEERRIEAERQAEIARLAAEEAELNRKIQEAQREATRQAALAKNAEERAKAEEARFAVEKQKALAAATSHEALDAVNAHFDNKAKDLAPPPQATRAEGQRIANDWDITVSDIHTLYRHHPNCVKIEPLLGEIKNILKSGGTVKGVVAKPIVKAGVKAGRQPMAIEV